MNRDKTHTHTGHPNATPPPQRKTQQRRKGSPKENKNTERRRKEKREKIRITTGYPKVHRVPLLSQAKLAKEYQYLVRSHW